MRDFHQPGRSSVYSENGMVATSHPLASKVALDTLQKGGNAIDAALTAALLLPICEPQMTGLYGDMFAMVKLPNSENIIGLNSSGKSPKMLSGDLLRSKGIKKIPYNSPEAITMPGAVRGFETLAKDFSTLGLSAACEPAIHYAKCGVPVAPRVAYDWEKNKDLLSNFSKKFYFIDNKVPKVGDVFKAPMQATVLEKIAANGADGFYKGEVANDLISSLNNLGGCHTLDDLETVSSQYVTPLSTRYRDTELFELPPNSQGATALILANILSGFDLKSIDPLGHDRVHLEAEASKLAYKVRNQYFADENFIKKDFNNCLSETFSRNQKDLINLTMASPDLESTTEEFHLDTVLLTVIDKERCAVSLIFSIFHSFGSGHASEKYGLLFQNRGAGFTLEKNHPNEIAGKKRPLHTIIPAMVKKDGQLLLSYGVMGGQYQPVGHIRILSNLVDYKMDLQTAIDMPRSFADSSGLLLENGYNEKIALNLKSYGHNVLRPDLPLGGAQAILIDNSRNILVGASDARKDGLAIGF